MACIGEEKQIKGPSFNYVTSAKQFLHSFGIPSPPLSSFKIILKHKHKTENIIKHCAFRGKGPPFKKKSQCPFLLVFNYFKSLLNRILIVPYPNQKFCWKLTRNPTKKFTNAWALSSPPNTIYSKITFRKIESDFNKIMAKSLQLYL